MSKTPKQTDKEISKALEEILKKEKGTEITKVIVELGINKICDADGTLELKINITEKSLYLSEFKIHHKIPGYGKPIKNEWKNIGKIIEYGQVTMIPAEWGNDMLGILPYSVQSPDRKELRAFVASFDELDAFMKLYEEVKTR